MTRSTNQVSHDLRPMLETIKEISDTMSLILPQLDQASSSNDAHLKGHFETCISAIESLKKCTGFAMIYLDEVDAEAKREGIEKHY